MTFHQKRIDRKAGLHRAFNLFLFQCILQEAWTLDSYHVRAKICLFSIALLIIGLVWPWVIIPLAQNLFVFNTITKAKYLILDYRTSGPEFVRIDLGNKDRMLVSNVIWNRFCAHATRAHRFRFPSTFKLTFVFILIGVESIGFTMLGRRGRCWLPDPIPHWWQLYAQSL